MNDFFVIFFLLLMHTNWHRAVKSPICVKSIVAINIVDTKATDLKAIFLKNACHTLIFVLKKIIHAFKNDRFFKKFVFLKIVVFQNDHFLKKRCFVNDR